MTLEQYILSKYSLIDGQVFGPRGLVQGTLLGKGYLGTGIRFEGKIRRVLMHRMVFLLKHGYLPETVDHINGNRASRGYTVRTKRYAKPRYEVNCDHQYLGVFDTSEQAQAAYLAAKVKAFGEFARTA